MSARDSERSRRRRYRRLLRQTVREIEADAVRAALDQLPPACEEERSRVARALATEETLELLRGATVERLRAQRRVAEHLTRETDAVPWIARRATAPEVWGTDGDEYNVRDAEEILERVIALTLDRDGKGFRWSEPLRAALPRMAEWGVPKPTAALRLALLVGCEVLDRRTRGRR